MNNEQQAKNLVFSKEQDFSDRTKVTKQSLFARALLSILKKTQNVTPGNFAYIPLQDFTPTSDIYWSKSIFEIDQQLYKKYSLTPDEIKFIETHVKEME